MTSETPRTDKEEFEAMGVGCEGDPTYSTFKAVESAFARQLERELAAKEAELAKLNDQLTRYSVDYLDAMEHKKILKDELSQERAKVARCVEVLQNAHTALDRNHVILTDWTGTKPKQYIPDFLASLDAQAERDARVLRAADEIHQAHKGRETELFVGIPACPICQVVRWDKKVNTSD